MTSFDRTELQRLVEQHDLNGLESFLINHSNLPGPRANLALAAATVDLLPTAGIDWAVETVSIWGGIDPERASGNDPQTMLPFVAAQAAGELWWAANPVQRNQLDEILHRAANDSRWRVREGVAMAFQSIGMADFDQLRTLLTRWVDRPTLLEWRAVVAGLAEPALMTQSDRPAYGLDLGMRAFNALMAVQAPNRKDDDAQALRKALGYAFSVFLAANLSGFSRLEEIARVNDKDAGWVVRENLKKSRIADRYSDECARVAALLPA
jgi:hypothetical protein